MSATEPPPDPRRWVPRHKHDHEHVRQAIAAGWPAVAPVLPELLQWLQDMNWPVAKGLTPFLASIGEPLVPEIRRIIATDDVMWKCWVVQELVKPNPAVLATLRPDLVAIATMEPRDEDEAYLRDVVQEALRVKQPTTAERGLAPRG